jgi:hypothetical protein
VQIANPASFLAQKILIHEQRDYKDKAKDLLYMHDTIEVFSANLDELQKLFRNDVAPKLHPRRVAEMEGAPGRLFGKVEDTIREAALMAAGRKLSPERLAETAQAGLKKFLEGRLHKEICQRQETGIPRSYNTLCLGPIGEVFGLAAVWKTPDANLALLRSGHPSILIRQVVGFKSSLRDPKLSPLSRSIRSARHR